MSAILSVLALAANSGAGLPRQDDETAAQERKIRDLVALVVRASGAHFRDESSRAPRVEELTGRFYRKDVSSDRFDFLMFVRMTGTIRRNGTVSYSGGSWPELPKGARRWTTEECETSARKSLAALLPAGFQVGPSTSRPQGAEVVAVTLDVVTALDPRVQVRHVGMRVDTVLGMPLRAEISKNWPAIARERIVPLITEEACRSEAERVYRAVRPFDGGATASGAFRYTVPNFALSLNEMTDRHRELVAARLATVVYQWTVKSADGSGRAQTVSVDALTGAAIAWFPNDLALMLSIGAEATDAVVPELAGARWTLRSASGTFARAEGEIGDGAPILLRRRGDELLLVRFDRSLGLVAVGDRVYRPDAALLKAMRAEKPVRAFGKKAG